MEKLTYRIGFVSTRLAGTDGVSLETSKCIKIITDFGHDCFCFCGESDWPSHQVYLVPEAHFKHPEIEKINAELFEKRVRTSETARNVFKLKEHLKSELYKFVRRFDISLLVTENALSLPMNIPLGLLLRCLGEKCVLVVTDKAGDEGQDYKKYLSMLANFLGISNTGKKDRNPPRGESGVFSCIMHLVRDP